MSSADLLRQSYDIIHSAKRSLENPTIEVIAPETNVKLKMGLEAVVIAVMIEKGQISYKITWQQGDEIKEHWVNDYLIAESGKELKRVIGFANGD